MADRNQRLSPEAWHVLQRLSQKDAAVCFVEDRYYFALREKSIDIVRSSTVDALMRGGYIMRDRTVEPWYVIGEGGKSALKRRAIFLEIGNDPLKSQQAKEFV